MLHFYRTALYYHIVCSLFLLGFCTGICKAGNGTPAPATGPADTITFRKMTDLNFGIILPGQMAGTVTLNPEGLELSFGGAMTDHTNKLLASPASFTVILKGSGTTDLAGVDRSPMFQAGGSIVSLLLPSSAELRNTHGETMPVDNFTLLRTGARISIGATVHVKANQEAGAYAGFFFITAITE